MATVQGARVTITPTDDVLVSRLREFAEGGGDTRPLMSRMGQYFVSSTQDRFKSQTDPDGNAWAPLSPGYLRRKKQNKDKILTLRGYLRRFIASQVLAPNEVSWGSNRIYAAIQQHGGTIAQAPQSRLTRFRTVGGRTQFAKKSHKRAAERWVERGGYDVKIPARPFLGVSAADNAEVIALVQDWLHRRMNGLPD